MTHQGSWQSHKNNLLEKNDTETEESDWKVNTPSESHKHYVKSQQAPWCSGKIYDCSVLCDKVRMQIKADLSAAF